MKNGWAALGRLADTLGFMRRLAVPFVILLLAGCSDDDVSVPADIGLDVRPDIIPHLDRGQPDLPMPDQAAPDQAAPDQAAPDLQLPDLLVPDLPPPDLPIPDQALPPAHEKCSSAAARTLATGMATAQGDTTLASNEFGSAVSCGGTSAYVGPQVYYTATLTAGKLYGLKLTPGPKFDPTLYAFEASSGCTGIGVNAGCAGHVSDVTGVGAAGVETLTLKPSTTGAWIIAVDGFSASDRGPFTLSLSEAKPAQNDRCAQATLLTLVAGKASAVGDTSTATNQFGTSITCGTSYDYDGPQLYYIVSLPAGKTAKVTVTPSTSWDLAAYAFTDATCTAVTVDKQCAAWFSDSAGAGQAESFSITTTTQQTFVLAVDSYAATQSGAFSLTIDIK